MNQVPDALATMRSEISEFRARQRLRAQNPGASVHRSAQVRSPERLRIGLASIVDAGAMLHCGGMDWSPENGGINIGDNCYVGPTSVLFGAGGIDIADSVLIGPGVVITSHQHTFMSRASDIREQPLEFGRVLIERDVWVGANATILPGIRVGAGSVIGAGAVVTHDVAPGVVVHGVPARLHRER